MRVKSRLLRQLFTTSASGVLALLAVSTVHAETVYSVTQTSYDPVGRLLCTAVRMNPAVFSSLPTDACALGTAGSFGNDRISKNFYDSAGQLAEVDRSVGDLNQKYARYYYNPDGTKLYEVDANNNTTQYAYDGFDRLSIIYYPCVSTPNCADGTDYESFTYDFNGSETGWRRRNSHTVAYTYDNLKRVILQTASDSTVPNVYTAYDLTNHVLYNRFGSTSGSGVTNVYDGLGRLDHTTDMNGHTIQNFYNQASARVGLLYPDAVGVNFYLDYANRLTSLAVSGYSTLITQNYDDLGRRVGTNRGGGGASYSYDNLGHLTSMTDDLAGTTNDVTWTFSSYNPAGQIATWGTSSTNYDYKQTITATVNQTYDGLNRDASIATLTGGYDADGNLANDGSRVMTYDIYNRLLTVTGGAVNLKLVYDPIGRLAQYSTDGGSTYTYFTYDGTNLIAEYNATGMTERYIHGSGTDEPLVWFHGSGLTNQRYFYQDYHGNVIAYTDGSSNLTELYKYGPYGEPKNSSNTDAWTGPNYSPASSRFRYTGQLIMPEGKLYYYKARVYDPMFGHFLQTDPAGDKDNLDLYEYTGDDPINGDDPTGLCNSWVQDCDLTVYLNGYPVIEIPFSRGKGTPTLVPPAPDPNGGQACDGQPNCTDVSNGITKKDFDRLQHRSDSNDSKGEDNDEVSVDDTGKVHGDLPNADDIPEDQLEEADQALGESIETRSRENDSFPRGNPNGMPEEQEQFRKYRQHADRITREQRLRERIRQRIRKRN